MGSGRRARPTPASAQQRPRPPSLLPRPPRAVDCASAPATRGSGGGGGILRSGLRRGSAGRGLEGREGWAGSGERGGGGAVHAGRAGEAAERQRRARAGRRGPGPRGDSGLREGLVEVALKGRHRFEEVARGRPPGPAPPRAAAVRISARQVSVPASCRAAHRGRHGSGQMVGAAWPAGSSSPRAPGGTPPAAGAPLQPFPRRGPAGVQRADPIPGGKGPGCSSIRLNFLKRFPASMLKCNQSFNRGREGSEKAGNGMTFFPWVRTHCEILPLCCLCSPACL